MYTKEQVAKTIDHAVLKPDYTDADLREHAEMCKQYGVYSMCVRPCDVKQAVDLLKGSEVKVSCVLSFPHGTDTSETKAFQAKQAVNDGVTRLIWS